MIRVDAVWLATPAQDTRAPTDPAVAVFGAARPHLAYVFASARANRMTMKVLVHDGIGICLCARRLDKGRFLWVNARDVRR